MAMGTCQGPWRGQISTTPTPGRTYSTRPPTDALQAPRESCESASVWVAVEAARAASEAPNQPKQGRVLRVSTAANHVVSRASRISAGQRQPARRRFAVSCT